MSVEKPTAPGKGTMGQQPGGYTESIGYAPAVEAYELGGWDGVLPLPAGKKTPPPDGYTGHDAPDPTAARRSRWVKQYPNGNLALRLPADVLCLDVDAYDGKPGAATLADLTAELGPLPPTSRGTSRLDDPVSGHYLFRVPTGLRWPGGLPGIDLIHHVHRYLVAWPSIHPNGARYRWYRPDAYLAAEGWVPWAYDLPDLPAAWVAHLTGGEAARPAEARGPSADVDSLLTDGEPCRAVSRVLADLDTASTAGGSRHDAMLKVGMRLLRLGEQGHHGTAGVYATVHADFVAAVAPDRTGGEREAEAEWNRAETGAVGKVTANPTAEKDRRCCGTEVVAGAAGPNLPPEKDVTDHVEAGHTLDELVLSDVPEAAAAGPGVDGLDVSNPKLAADYLRDELGTGKLAGVFLRGSEPVRTPRIGEDGYVPPDEGSDDGPAQVRPMNAVQLAAHISYVRDCYVVRERDGKKVALPALFPEAAAKTAVHAADHLRGVRTLRGVTHTPLVRADGSILTAPGYDDPTGLLHLPDPGLTVPTVPDAPTAEEVKRAADLLTKIVADFPFITDHDRVNYLGLLITPVLRSLCPPPYKLGAITAPSPGSGKTLLADVIRELHGGVFRSEMPRDDEEIRKQVSAILDVTTGPVVHFDNLSGVLRSSVLAGLLTSAQWDDRRLGATQMLSVPNDRLWLITGNNLAIGGDLPRRTITVTIDPRMPNPHLRTGYVLDPLLPWVREHRGELLHAVLILVRAWHVAGRPTRGKRSSDSFGVWIETVDGILSHAGIAGRFDDPTSQPEPVGADDTEWADLLHALHQVFGSETFTVRALLDRMAQPGRGTLTVDVLPAELAEKAHRSNAGPAAVSKSLGMWLRNRTGRYAGDFTVRNAGKDRNGIVLWRVDTAGGAVDLAGSGGSAGSGSDSFSRDTPFLGRVKEPPAPPAGEASQTPQTPQTPQQPPRELCKCRIGLALPGRDTCESCAVVAPVASPLTSSRRRRCTVCECWFVPVVPGRDTCERHTATPDGEVLAPDECIHCAHVHHEDDDCVYSDKDDECDLCGYEHPEGGACVLSDKW